MLLKTIVTYYLIGLVMTFVFNGKSIHEGINEGEYPMYAVIFGTLISAFAAPIWFTMGVIEAIKERREES